MTPPTKTEVCIVGDGIVGRTLALALADKGLRVGLVQAARTTDVPDVRAYSLNVASRQLLESVRGWPVQDACPVKGIAVYDQRQPAVQFDASSVGQEALAWIVDAAAIEAALNTALDYAPKITRLNQSIAADLQVICEGKGRQTAYQRGATEQAMPYAQTAVACRLMTSQPHAGWARQWFDQGDVIGLLGQQTHQLSLVWSTSTANAARLMTLTDEAFCAELMAVGGDQAHAVGQVMGDLQCASTRQSWPLKLSQLDQWSGPGWVVAGDAAHTVHPLTGQGLNMGLGDVATLTRLLAERDYWRSVADPKLLRAYERERKAQVARMSGASDALHNLFTHPHPVVGQLRQMGTQVFNQTVPVKNWVMRQAMGL